MTVILIFTFCTSFSQLLTPPIQNHSSVEYDGASQNWDVAVDEKGFLYAANNQGLLMFDGQQWDLLPLENNAVIRSVLPHEGKIFIGSYREFGYWTANKTGKMEYTSLMPLLKPDAVKSEEFWEIIPYQDAIYFRSFGAIYRYKDDKIEPVLDVVSNKMLEYKGRLLISAGKNGVFYLNSDGSIQPLPNQEVLKGKRVLDMEVDGDNLLIGTKDRLYLFNGAFCKPYSDNQLNDKLANFEFNHIMKIGVDQLLIATVRNGVLLYNTKSRNIDIYNRESGLQNNTVLGMAATEGKVWLGLDDGIDEIDFNFPLKFYTDHTGELGAVYDLEKFENTLYAASNTGVYTIGNEGLTMLQGAQGHSWNLKVVEDRLMSNHNSGTYFVKGDVFIPVDKRTGSFVTVQAFNDRYFIGNYTGISLYKSDTRTLSNLKGIQFPVKKLIMNDELSGWAEHANEGVFRFRLTPDFSEINDVSPIHQPSHSSDDRSELFSINGEIAILQNKEWYRYNRLKDTLVHFDELKNYTNHTFLLEDQNGYWFVNRNNHAVSFTNFKDQKVSISFEDLNKRSVKGNEALIKAGDSLYYLTLKDGFAKIDLHQLIKYRKNQRINQPILKGIVDEQRRHELSSEPTIPYHNAGTLNFYAGLTGSSQLRYRLSGEESLQGVAQKGKVTIQNLPHGEYRLELFALSPQGLISDPTPITFTIGAPWYLSLPMKFLYLLLAMSIVVSIYFINRQKLKSHRLRLEQKLEKEHQEQIARLEKKRLEDEIMIKRKELANTTMMAAKKNEVLMDIQGELKKDKDKFSNQYRLKHIMTKINKAIKNKDEWQVFETNFKEVHEDFSKQLLTEHPDLTSKDLKLCSYLKMNLSSKEIAPLMGKSVRGVEVHRYRLRKKMDLDSQQNLSSYLIKNF